MTPRIIVSKWVETFNKRDAEALANFYHENATNHQVVSDPIVGRLAIEQFFKDAFAEAEMVCIVENIFEEGDWAILEWKDPLGLRGCGFFHIIDNKILFQRGYWDKLSFLRIHNLPIPQK